VVVLVVVVVVVGMMINTISNRSIRTEDSGL
jgi:hypothetical protein